MATTRYDKLLEQYDKHCKRIAQSTAIKIDEPIAEKRKRISFNEKEYVRWFEYYFPNYAKVKCAGFHKSLANAIIKNDRISILAEMYRSAGKSVHIDMGIPLYLMYVKQDMKFMLLIGETEKKAKKLLSGLQAQLQYNKRLINDYGVKFQFGDWANGDFTTTEGVKFQSYGFGQNPRGAREEENRPDYIVVDDVDSKKHVNNNSLMSEAVDFITEDVWGCFDSNDESTERFVFANNNFHKNSITNRLKIYFKQAIAKAKQEGEDHDFKIITVNAVKDLINFVPTWIEKTSSKYWKKKYNGMPRRSFMREFMNTHIQEGKVFKEEDQQWCDIPRLNKFDGLVFYGDLSYKDKGDFKAMILLGKLGREFFIIYTYLRRGSRAKCAEWLYNLYEDKNLSKHDIKYLIEGLFSMDEFVNDFDVEGDTRGYYIPVVADKRSKANKFDRIESIAGHFERRHIWFNAKEKDSPDQIELVDQFLGFEKGAEINDDGPDAVHGGFSELNRATFVDKFPVATISRASLIANSKNRF